MHRCATDAHHAFIHRLTDAEIEPYLAHLDGVDPASLPLYGVPFAIKDNIDLAGIPTTAACPAFAYVPERSATIVLYFSVSSSVVGLCTIPFGWVVPSPQAALLLIAAGLIGGVAQILLTSAYRFADASIIAPFEYSSMLLALLVGYFAFSEVPTMMMLSGAGLVILAGGLIIWRERKLGLERAAQRKAMTP